MYANACMKARPYTKYGCMETKSRKKNSRTKKSFSEQCVSFLKNWLRMNKNVSTFLFFISGKIYLKDAGFIPTKDTHPPPPLPPSPPSQKWCKFHERYGICCFEGKSIYQIAHFCFSSYGEN